MAAGDKVVKTVLKYEVQGQQAVTQSLATVRKQADADFQRQIANANLLADARLKGDVAFERQLATSQMIVTTQTAATQQLTAQVTLAERLANAAKVRESAEAGFVAQLRQEAFTQAVGSGASASATLSKARDAAIALPGVGYQSPLVLGLRALQLVADKTGASLLQVGVLGASIAVLAAVFITLKNNADKAAKATIEASKAFLQVSVAAADQTREQLQADLDKAISQLDIYQAFADKANADLERYRQTRPGGNVAINELDATFMGLQGSAEAANEELSKAQDAVANYSILLAGNTTAANDAAEAAHKLAEAQLEGLQLNLDINQMTKAQREERLRVLGSENSIMNALVISGQLNTEALIAVADAQVRNREEAEALAETTGTLADILKAEADAKQLLIDKSDAVNEVTRDLAEAQTDAAEAAAKVAEVLLRYEEAATKFNEKVAEIAANLLEAEANANARAEEDRLEAEAKANEQREDLREKHLKKLEQIESKANAMIANAIASRDALALYLAQQNKAQQIKDEKEDFEERKKAIDKSLKDQNAVIDKRLKEQLQTAKEAADKALAQERKRRDEEIRIIQAAHQKALDEERRFNAALEVQQALSLFSRQYWNNAVIAGQQAVDNATALYVQNLANYANGISITAALIGGLTGGTTGTGGGYGLPPPITPGVFGAPSPTSYTQNNAAHFTFSPTINAATERQITQAVDRRVHQMFQQARGRR